MSTVTRINGGLELRVGQARVPLNWSLPLPIVLDDRQPNHVLIVTGTQKAAGRNAYVNFLASTLRLLRRDFAVVELDTALGSASLAHRAEGAPAKLISAFSQQFLIEVIDAVDEFPGHTVIVSIQSGAWLPFAAVEEVLLDGLRAVRPVGYAFVDPTGAASRLEKHKAWLKGRGHSAYEHRLVLRGQPLYSPAQMPRPGSHPCTVMPHFEKQVADAVFARDLIEGRSSKPVTFHAAMQAASSGTKAVMKKPVVQAMSDIGYWLDSAGALCTKEFR